MGEQKETWVSLQTIARDMGYKSRGAVHKYLQQLKDLGMISSRNEYDKRRGITRTYYTRVHPYKVWGDDWYKPWDAYWETDEDGGPLDPGLEVDEEGIPIDHVFPEETDCSLPESDIDLSQRAASSPGESAQGEEFNKKNLSNLSNEDVAQILTEGEPEPSVDSSPINGKEKVGFNKLDILRGGFSKKEAPTDIRKQLAAEAKQKYKTERDEAALRRKEEAARASEICPEGVSRDVWEEQRANSLLHKFYTEKMAEYGFGAVPRPTGKDYGQIKTFFKKMGNLDKSKKMMDYVLKNWTDLRRRYASLGNHPGIGVFASRWMDEMMPEVFKDQVHSDFEARRSRWEK
jgi:hypothetical protein